jgi:hypothetical protein
MLGEGRMGVEVGGDSLQVYSCGVVGEDVLGKL